MTEKLLSPCDQSLLIFNILQYTRAARTIQEVRANIDFELANSRPGSRLSYTLRRMMEFELLDYIPPGRFRDKRLIGVKRTKLGSKVRRQMEKLLGRLAKIK